MVMEGMLHQVLVDKTVKIWEVSNEKDKFNTLLSKVTLASVNSVSFSGDGRYVASASS